MTTTSISHQPRIIQNPHTCPTCGKPAHRVTLYTRWTSPHAIPKPLDLLGRHIVYIECRNAACPGPAFWRCVRLSDDGPLAGPVYGHIEIDRTTPLTELDSIRRAINDLSRLLDVSDEIQEMPS